MGTMLGIQSSLNGAAGALAPPLGGFLYRGSLGCSQVPIFHEFSHKTATVHPRPEHVLSLSLHVCRVCAHRLANTADFSCKTE